MARGMTQEKAGVRLVWVAQSQALIMWRRPLSSRSSGTDIRSLGRPRMSDGIGPFAASGRRNKDGGKCFGFAGSSRLRERVGNLFFIC